MNLEVLSNCPPGDPRSTAFPFQKPSLWEGSAQVRNVFPWNPGNGNYASESDFRYQRGLDGDDIVVELGKVPEQLPDGLQAVGLGAVGDELRAIGEAGKLQELLVFHALDRDFGLEEILASACRASALQARSILQDP